MRRKNKYKNKKTTMQYLAEVFRVEGKCRGGLNGSKTIILTNLLVLVVYNFFMLS